MTTIAYRDGVMAADMQATFGDTRLIGYNKLRVGSRSVMGYAGVPRFAEAIFSWWADVEESGCSPRDWYAYRDDAPEIPDGEMLALVATQGYGVWRLYHDLHAVEVFGPFAAIGTGEPFALGAMEHGASAFEAAVIAAKYDLFSSLPIDAVALP